MRRINPSLRTATKPLIYLVFIVLGCLVLSGTAVFSQDMAIHRIGVDEVIDHDVYLHGETVAIDGTVNGNAFLAGKNVSINGTVTNDVYVAGETVTIAGTVGGDAVTAGRKILFQGKVDADLIGAGQSLVLDGSVGDDARLAGQVLQLRQNTQIGDSVVVAGASLETEPQTRIGGSLNLAMGQAELSGTVNKDLVGSLGSAQLNGAVGGDARLMVGALKPDVMWPNDELEAVDVPVGLTLGSTARIQGNLIYESPQEADISEAAQVEGDLTYRAIEPGQPSQFLSKGWGISLIQRFLSLLLVGALLLWWKPDWVQALVDKEKEKPLPSLGWGALGGITIGLGGVAIAGVTLLSTALFAFILPGLAFPTFGLGTIATLVLIIGVAIFVGLIAQIVISVWGGQWLMQRLGGVSNRRFASLALGLILYVSITAVPGLGTVINLIVSLLGLGALWLWLKTQRSSKSSTLPGET